MIDVWQGRIIIDHNTISSRTFILFLMIVNFNNLKYLISFTTENGAEIC